MILASRISQRNSKLARGCGAHNTLNWKSVIFLNLLSIAGCAFFIRTCMLCGFTKVVLDGIMFASFARMVDGLDSGRIS